MWDTCAGRESITRRMNVSICPSGCLFFSAIVVVLFLPGTYLKANLMYLIDVEKPNQPTRQQTTNRPTAKNDQASKQTNERTSKEIGKHSHLYLLNSIF